MRGALFVIPIWLSTFLLELCFNLSETWLGAATQSFVAAVLPKSLYEPWFPGAHIPGLSLFTALIVLGIVGAFASWHVGRQGLRLIDLLFLSIPGISSIYSSVRKMVDAIGEPGQSRFQKVVFVEWPGKGLRTVGFVTNEIQASDAGATKRYVVFIPHMPNPTSGFVLLVDADSVTESNMTPDEGLKYCLSLGVLIPPAVPLDKI